MLAFQLILFFFFFFCGVQRCSSDVETLIQILSRDLQIIKRTKIQWGKPKSKPHGPNPCWPNPLRATSTHSQVDFTSLILFHLYFTFPIDLLYWFDDWCPILHKKKPIFRSLTWCNCKIKKSPNSLESNTSNWESKTIQVEILFNWNQGIYHKFIIHKI